MAKDTGASTVLAVLSTAPSLIVPHADHVALLVAGAVYVVPAVGGEPLLVASGDTATSVAIDGDWIYWAGSDQHDPNFPGLIRRARLDGSGRETLLDEPLSSIRAFGISRGFVYWSDLSENGVMRMPAEGGTPVRLVTAELPWFLTFDGATTYFLDKSLVNPTVVEVDAAGASQVTSARLLVLALGSQVAPAVVFRRGQVYWLNDGSWPIGQLVRSPLLPLQDYVPAPVFDLLSQKELSGLTSDDAHLYVTDCASRSLKRIPL